MIAALTIGGRLMALPHYLGIRALLYHADMLRQAGIAQPPADWDALLADSAKIKQTTGKDGFGIAGTGVRSPQELIMYLAQQGASLAVPTRDGKFRTTGRRTRRRCRARQRCSPSISALLDQRRDPVRRDRLGL